MDADFTVLIQASTKPTNGSWSPVRTWQGTVWSFILDACDDLSKINLRKLTRIRGGATGNDGQTAFFENLKLPNSNLKSGFGPGDQ